MNTTGNDIRYIYKALVVVLLMYLAPFGVFAQESCKASDFSVKITKVGWADTCRTRSCPFMKGAAVLTSKCAVAAGPQVRIVGLDEAGDPITVRELWPFSTSNITPGKHPISLDHWLDYDPEIKSFEIQVFRVQTW